MHRTVMGRKVIHHSPPKHPEQGDPYAAIDKMTEAAAQGKPGTLRAARQSMKGVQRESPSPAKGLMDYIKRLGGQ